MKKSINRRTLAFAMRKIPKPVVVGICVLCLVIWGMSRTRQWIFTWHTGKWMSSIVWSYEQKERGLQFYVYHDENKYKSCVLKNSSISEKSRLGIRIPNWELHGYYFEPYEEGDDDFSDGKFVTGNETYEKTRHGSSYVWWKKYNYVLLPIEDLAWPLESDVDFREVFIDEDTMIRIWKLDELWVLLYTCEDSKEGYFELYNDPLEMLYDALET